MFFHRHAKKEKCDIVLVLGGSTSSNFKPIISINQNLLPFFDEEILKYKFSLNYFKFKILKYFLISTYNKSSGIIFLTNFSYEHIKKYINLKNINYTIIGHGVDKIFFNSFRTQRKINDYDENNPYRLLYISNFEYYKNHQQVIKIVSKLRQNNYPITLDLIGGGNKQLINKIKKIINKENRNKKYIFFRGIKGKNDILNYYNESDLFIYASSCESFGQILIESMAAKLPILCSSKSGLPRTAKNGAVYFDPFDKIDFYNKLKLLIDDRELREKISISAFEEAKKYKWENCSFETFNFISTIYQKNNNK